MKLKSMTISKGMTVNLGGYNSTRVEVGLSADFEDDQDLADQLEILSDLVTAKLRDEVKKISSPRKQVLMETDKKTVEINSDGE